MTIARVCLFSLVSLVVLAAIDGGKRARPPRNHDALSFCSWLKDYQQKKCEAQPLLGLSARNGVELALKECGNNFKDRRWNCSGVTIADVFQRQRMLEADMRESSYLHAITAAGVTFQITKGCSQGNWDDCGCDPQPSGRGRKEGEPSWEWGGCSENYRYGYEYSTKFMDPSKNAGKTLSDYLVRHNNEAGRRVIKDNMDKTCRCHGVSGSCTVRVCWRTMPKMEKVASLLRKKFDNAVRVKLNKNKTKLTRIYRKRRGRKRNTNNKRPPPSSLVYAADSPNFCEANKKYGVLGPVGRTCNKASIGPDSCSMLCCGKGYNTVNRVKDVKCNCAFIWCCQVSCDICKEEWVEHTCK